MHHSTSKTTILSTHVKSMLLIAWNTEVQIAIFQALPESESFCLKLVFVFLNAAIIPIMSAFTVKGHHLLNVVFKRTPGSAEIAFLIKA